MSVLLTSRQSRGSPESTALLLPLAESMSSPPEAAPQGVSVNVYLQAYMHLLQGLCAPGFKALLSPADQELADFLAGSVCDSPAFVAFSRLVLRKADWIRFDRGDIDKYLRPFRPWASGAAGEDAGEQAEEQGGEDMVEEDAGGEPLAADDGAAAQRADSSEDPLPAPPVDTAALMASLEALQLVDLITTSSSSSSSSSEESIFDAIASCLSSEELKGVYRKMDKTVLKAQRKEEVLQLLRKQCKSQRSISGFFAKPGGATGSSNSSRLLRAISEVLLKTGSGGGSSSSSNGVLFFRVKPSVLLLLRRAQRLQQLSSSYSTEGCSVYAQMASNLDLLVRFKKLAFPQYEVLLTQPLFPSRRLFEQWELSMEIKFALLCLLPPSGAGGHGSILFSLREKVELKNMFQCFSDVFKSAAFNKFVGVRFDDLDQVAAHTAAKAASGGGGGALGLDEHSSALAQEYLFVLSIVAFISFSMELDAAGAGSAKDRPHVFAQFEAGAALADTLCTVAATLEARKSYSYAVHVYLLLLDRGYFKHRRGSWYTRLSIDLEHQGLLESSLAAVQRGLSDGRVKPADRLTLQKRLQNTLAKIRRRAAKEVTAGGEGASKGCSSDLFDSHLSGLVDAVNEHIAACLAMAASGASSSSSSSRAAHTGLCLDCTYQNAPSATSCELCCGASFRLAEEAPKGEPVIVIIDDDDDDGGSGDLFMGVAADDGKENCRVDEDAVLAEADSAEGFVEQLLSHDRAPPASTRTVTISGRRFGDNKVGKNRFLSDSDSVLTVEAYVLEKCLHVDADESEEFRAAVRGGGWGGWHCEGSPLRGLFNLLMWDCLYSTVPNVFVNPYQEAPLDLSTPAFYSNRKSIVDERVSAIAAASQDELLAFVAAAYTTHYKEKTLCVSWKHQLKVLQLIALCVGAATMAQLCKVFCCNYKQFRSGLPDLLLVRVTDINGSLVDLADLLGDEWESLTFSIFEPVRKRSRGGFADGDELIAPPPGRRRYSRGGFGTVKTAAAAAADGYDEFNDRPQEREAALRAAKESRRAEIQAREQRMRAELSPECLLRAHTFECMSVEVKGPNDHLADKQELWLRALCGVGLESIVVKVKEDFRTLRGIIT